MDAHDERVYVVGEIRRHKERREQLTEQYATTGNPRTGQAMEEQDAIITALEKGLRVLTHRREIEALVRG